MTQADTKSTMLRAKEINHKSFQSLISLSFKMFQIGNMIYLTRVTFHVLKKKKKQQNLLYSIHAHEKTIVSIPHNSAFTFQKN